MSSLPGATAGPDGEPPMAESEPMLPLRELDRALAPIRRVVGYALQPGGSGRVRYLGANLAPHAARALALDLPGALRESLAFVAAQLDGFDAAADDDRRERLSGMFAALTRIDALAGLPVPQVLRPVHKVLQVDVAEPEPAPTGTEPSPGRAAPSVPTTGPSVAAAGSVAATNPAPDDEDDDEDEDEGDEFAGDLGHPLAELVPDLAEAFAAASIETVRDLVLRRPAVAETLTPIHGAGREIPDGRAAAGGRIRASYTVYRGSAVAGRWSVVVGAGPLRVRWAEPAPEGWREVDRRVVVAGTYGDGALLDAELASADDRGVRLASWGIPGVPDHRIRQV
ncbi:MAG: hypothetical protein ABMB14_22575, partial [Myxococcota bacterium]